MSESMDSDSKLGHPMSAELQLHELVAMARTDFYCFVELMFPVLHPGEKLIFAPYIDVLTRLLMNVAIGKWSRVIINMPPRHLKSILTSVLYTAWRLGRDPTAKFICISYSDDLAHDLSALTRRVMMSAEYQVIFPQTKLEKKAVYYISTTMGGYRYSTSVGSHITGFGADEIIIDDPMQPEEAHSAAAKANVWNWISSSVLPRFNKPDEGRLIMVMHRLAPDDPSAKMEASSDTILRLPFIAEMNEKFMFEGKVFYHRMPGEVLNPARFDEEAVKRLKAEIAPHVFAAQYQQRPTIGGSGMLSIDKWHRYNPASMPEFELLIHSWDIGATTSGNASVCTAWGLTQNSEHRDIVYLLDVQRLKLELPEVRQAVKVANRRDRPALIILDERGVGLGVFQELEREGFRNIMASTATSEPQNYEGDTGRRPNQSKIDRFGKAALQISDGRAMIPTHAPWLEHFMYEVCAFPNIADDDQVDSMTQLVANLDRAIRNARYYQNRKVRPR